MITVTDKALNYFKRIIEKSETTGNNRGIRIGIKAGGCSGLEYFFEPVSDHDKYDHLMILRGVRLFVDPKSMKVMTGTEIDCSVVNLIEKIIFNNPNAKNACGCGTSFELKDKKDIK